MDAYVFERKVLKLWRPSREASISPNRYGRDEPFAEFRESGLPLGRVLGIRFKPHCDNPYILRSRQPPKLLQAPELRQRSR